VHVTTAPADAPVPVFAEHCVARTNAPPLTESSQVQEYGAVPVEGVVPETVNTWSASKAGRFGVGEEGALSTEATVTVAEGLEGWVSAVCAESVTNSSNVYVSPTVSTFAPTKQVSVAPAEAPDPPLTAHWVAAAYEPPFTDTSQVQEYGAVPVTGTVPVRASAWLTSSAVALPIGVPGAVKADATVTKEDAPEVCVSAEVALSVTCNSKAYVSPAVSVLPGIEQPTGPDPVPLLTVHWVAEPYEPPFTDTSHVQLTGDVPVEGTEPVTPRVWSTSNEVAPTDGAAGAVSADDTVTVGEVVEVAVSVVVALSVT